MKYKLFISDYDGTLGKAPENDIDSETIKAINEYTKKGGIFIVCSGRETLSITKICREQGLKGLVVSFQGARISDIQTGEYILDAGLDGKIALEIIKEIKKYDLEPVCFVDNKIYFEKPTEFANKYLYNIELQGIFGDIESVLSGKDKVVCKLCGLGPFESVNRAVNELNQKYKGQKVLFNSGDKYLFEAINPKYAKGQAVRFLCEKYGVPFEQVLTVGDSTNDIGLVQGPWHGVCVGDGREELKAVAKEVTVPFDQKPVLTLLKKYCLD